MTLFVVLGTLLGILVGLQLPYLLTKIVTWAEKKRFYKDLYPTEVYESLLCKDPHDWLEVPSGNGYGENKMVNICTTCGFIPSNNLMATKVSLDRIVYNKKLFAFEKKLEQDFINRENELLDHFLKQEKLNMDNLVEVYNAGMTANRRFVIFKMMVAEQERGASDER